MVAVGIGLALWGYRDWADDRGASVVRHATCREVDRLRAKPGPIQLTACTVLLDESTYTESLKMPSELFIPVTAYGSSEPKLIWATRNQVLRERLRPLARLRANGAVSRDHAPTPGVELRPSWRVTGYFPVADRFSDEQHQALEELALASPLPVLIDGEPPDTTSGIAKIVCGLLISALGVTLLVVKGRTTLRGVPQSSKAPSGNVA